VIGRLVRGVVAVVSSVAVGAGCASDAAAPPALPAVAARLVADRPAPATDTIEVWVCQVPLDSSAPIYGGLPLRQPLTPDDLVARIGERVSGYFATVSHGAYVPTFVAGGTVAMSASDTDADCVDGALDRSSADADTVLAVADAEHAADQPGGWGRPGTWPTCDGTCPASTTLRAAYVGASDFHPDWGPVPLLDLIEHELGHTLGLPHSGSPASGGDQYLSALDVMSNSAAPRDVDPARRDAPDTIAVDRLDLGWLPVADAAVATPDGLTVDLAPSIAPAGTRVVLAALDDHRMLTFEYLIPTGFDDHLPEAGVAVHLVDDSAGTNVLRVQDTLGSDPPHTDLLGAGDEWSGEGWQVRVVTVGATARLEVSATDR
jgi:hypothetical protein